MRSEFWWPVVIFVLAGCQPKSMPTSDVGHSSSVASATSIDRVTAGSPVRKTLQLFTEQPGRVVAFEETRILSKLSGYVDSVQVDIGDRVVKGQTLMRIHAPEYKDQVEHKRGLLGQAEAEVRQAEAQVVSAEAAASSAKSLVAQAEASVGRADADYARWQSELNRIQQLVSKGSVTAKLADETASQFQSAEAAKKEMLASIESAKARHRESEAQIKTAQADVDAAKAKLKVAQAELDQAETMLQYSELKSPFDGFVTSRHVDAGHYVQPAGASDSRPLITIANLSKVRVFVNVPESEAAWVDAGFEKAEAGDSVTILSPTLPGGKLEARVTRTGLQLDPQSRTLSVEVDLINSDLKLLPGSFVTTKILLEQRDNVLVLPIAAIVKSSDGTRCCVVENGKIQFRAIEIGMRAGDEIEIVSGLEGTENVVLLRAAALQAGQPVEVIAKKP